MRGTTSLAILLLGAMLLVTSSLALAGPPPNVVLVITDDQGYGDISAHGNPIVRTPHLDALFRESIRLTNFHVDPTCSPTRSALMSGRYSTKTGVWHTIAGRSLMATEELTLAEIFKANGYRTGMFGKWHLGDAFPLRPQDQGFDTVFHHGGGGVGQTPDYWGNDYFDDTYWYGERVRPAYGYCSDVWFNAAGDFIDDAVKEQRPFFAYIATNAPHGPYLVAERYRREYRDQVPSPTGRFFGMIANIDENVGRLMKMLQQRDLLENTLFVFMTDNGTAQGENVFNSGMRGKKGSEYEGGHRVPCYFHWPAGGLVGGRDVDQLTAHIDLRPTLVELCDLREPAGPVSDGQSLVKALRGDKQVLRDRTLFVHSQRILHPVKWRKSSVMTDTWRLVNGQELYDVRIDPGQKRDLAADHPQLVNTLRGQYDAWWDSLQPAIGRTVRAGIGRDTQSETRLTCHDWLSDGNIPWHQGAVRRGPMVNGPWAVQVLTPGRYAVTLSRWPRQLGQPLEAVQAELEIQGKKLRQRVRPQQPTAQFVVELQAGEAMLQGTLTAEDGESRGAYYAYVRLMPPGGGELGQ